MTVTKIAVTSIIGQLISNFWHIWIYTNICGTECPKSITIYIKSTFGNWFSLFLFHCDRLYNAETQGLWYDWYQNSQLRLILTIMHTIHTIMMSHGHHGVANDRQLDCLFNWLFRFTLNKYQRFVSLAFCEEKPPVTPDKGPIMW